MSTIRGIGGQTTKTPPRVGKEMFQRGRGYGYSTSDLWKPINSDVPKPHAYIIAGEFV